MGHIGMHRLKQMVAKRQIKDIEALTGVPKFCEACVMGKMKKLPFKRSQTITRGPLDIVHSDVGGPVTPTSRDGYRYWVTFIDVWSRGIWVLFAKKKSDVEKLYDAWKAEVQAFFKAEIGTLTLGDGWTCFFITDGGGEYAGKEFEARLKSEGVTHQTTTPDTPESNGIGERANQTLVTKATAMLADSGLPRNFWTYAMAMAAHLITRSPATGIKGQIPYTKLTDRPVDASLFHPFGCITYALVHKEHRNGKFNNHATKCVLIGYPPNKKGYLLLDVKTKRIFTSRHVEFDETGSIPEGFETEKSDVSDGQWETFLNAKSQQATNDTPEIKRPWAPTVEDVGEDDEDTLEAPSGGETASAEINIQPSQESHYESISHAKPLDTPSRIPRPKATQNRAPLRKAPTVKVAGTRRSARQRTQANKNAEYDKKPDEERLNSLQRTLEREAKRLAVRSEGQSVSEEDGNKPEPDAKEPEDEWEDHIHFAGLSSENPTNDNLPESLQDVYNRLDGDKWRTAMEEELENLQSNNIYEEVPVPNSV
jgi:transposase InsO family protein